LAAIVCLCGTPGLIGFPTRLLGLTLGFFFAG
jgi:hypothetical protein